MKWKNRYMLCSDKGYTFIHLNEDGTPWVHGVERYSIGEAAWGPDDRRMSEEFDACIAEMLPTRPEAKPGEKPFLPRKN